MARDVKKQTNAEKLVFYHYDPSYDDDKLDQIAEDIAEENLIFAKEGLEIIL